MTPSPNRLKPSVLCRLFQLTDAEQFLSSAWPKEPFVAHGSSESLAALTGLSFLQSVETLLASWPKLVQAHLPDARDEVSAVDVSAAVAKKLYSNKMALLFNQAETMSPVLKDWLADLRCELGLPISTNSRCMIYATPIGQGTAAHFDQNINFVLQLSGEKTWWLAPNETVVNPTQRHTLGQPLDVELASYVEKKMPAEMPSGATAHTLRAGSVLFVPRGFWHRTEAHTDALALNFTFSQPTWIDLFTAALRSRLLLSPAWRELADGVNSADAGRRDDAAYMLDALLADLATDLPNWQAADILAATEG